ncbi:MAG: hydrogenase 3 maturation endopeptidase HyCI [Candidatus Omnitrophica bacterium]|nr:hydrogenase 3 maturation endopeptidase HyCI [Candidatus Omnitrophota bacterium]MBU4148987.1 hydrogenase 3 maturation endopeptidase HyCI [Candidatus Omnitrophota bacterium]
MLNLKAILKGKVVILCLGNPGRGDDGAGSAIASAIKGKTDCEVIDAGVTPENYTGVIIKLKPDTILIIDTVLFEGRPGEVRLFSGEDLRSGKISTHDVSPKLLIEYLRSSTNAKIYILGIRPKSNKLGETLSDEVKEAVDKIVLHLSPAQGKVIDNIKGVC